VSAADLELARSLVHGALGDLVSVEECLRTFDSQASAEDQVLRIAGLVEAVRAARTGIDGARLSLVEAALSRGASPRLLDLSDGTSD